MFPPALSCEVKDKYMYTEMNVFLDQCPFAVYRTVFLLTSYCQSVVIGVIILLLQPIICLTFPTDAKVAYAMLHFSSLPVSK